MAQRGRNRLDGADAHDVRRHAARGVADKAGEWFEPEALDRTLAGQNQGTCAVRGLRAVARRDRAARREHRAQLGQALDGGVGARALVQADQPAGFEHLAGGQIRGAVHHLHRSDLVLELAGRHGCQRALVRGQGKLVLRLPAHLPLGGHFLGGQAHAVGDANVVVIAKHGRRERGRVAHHRHHAHALHAGGDHHISLAHANAVGRHLHRAQARGAKAVHRDAAHAVRQASQHGGHAGHVQALLCFWDGAAANDVFDAGRIQPGRLCQHRLQRLDQQVVRAQVAQRAPVRAADRRARGRDDVGVLYLFHVELRVSCAAACRWTSCP